MIIYTTRLRQEGDSFVGEEPAGMMELDNDRFLRENGPVRYDLFAQIVSDRLVVRGKLEVVLDIECSRCLGFFSTTVTDSSFLRAYELSEATETVDLTDDIREGLLLAVPNYWICSSACKGLCPQCGVNLNLVECSCDAPVAETPWQKLDALVVPVQSEKE